MKYFINCKSLEELKIEYKKQAMLHHPDRPQGSESIMKDINNQYDVSFAELKEIKNDKGFTSSEVANEYKDIISKIINIEKINIELCGNWLWIHNVKKEDKEIQAQLKELKFRYSKKKELWYWRNENFKSKFRKKGSSMDEIRNKYGSVGFKTKQKVQLT